MGTAQAALKMMMTHLNQELKDKKVYVGYFPLDNPPIISDEKKKRNVKTCQVALS